MNMQACAITEVEAFFVKFLTSSVILSSTLPEGTFY